MKNKAEELNKKIASKIEYIKGSHYNHIYKGKTIPVIEYNELIKLLEEYANQSKPLPIKNIQESLASIPSANPVIGECGKHPGQSMIDCPLCAMKKPLDPDVILKKKPLPSDEEIEKIFNIEYDCCSDNPDINNEKAMTKNAFIKAVYEFTRDNYHKQSKTGSLKEANELLKGKHPDIYNYPNSVPDQPKQIDLEDLKDIEYKELFNILSKIGAELQKRQYSTAPNDFIKSAIDVCLIGSNKN